MIVHLPDKICLASYLGRGFRAAHDVPLIGWGALCHGFGRPGLEIIEPCSNAGTALGDRSGGRRPIAPRPFMRDATATLVAVKRRSKKFQRREEKQTLLRQARHRSYLSYWVAKNRSDRNRNSSSSPSLRSSFGCSNLSRSQVLLSTPLCLPLIRRMV